MAISRVTIGGWRQETGTTSRVTINGWRQETASAASAALTGTASGATEGDIVTGGKTIILTLTGDTWVALGAAFDAQRANIIQGLDSAASETLGWNLEVRDKEVVGAVVRTSDAVVTITLSASSLYNITASETVTCTIPATALTLGSPITATPTFSITATVAFQPFWIRSNNLLGGGMYA